MILRMTFSTIALAGLLTALLAGCQKGSAPEKADHREPLGTVVTEEKASGETNVPQAPPAETDEGTRSEVTMPDSLQPTAPAPAETPAPSASAVEKSGESEENEPVKLGRIFTGVLRAARSFVPVGTGERSEESPAEVPSDAPQFVPPTQQP